MSKAYDATYSYAYDTAGNKLSKTDAKGTTYYTYDELNRLKTVKDLITRREVKTEVCVRQQRQSVVYFKCGATEGCCESEAIVWHLHLRQSVVVRITRKDYHIWAS